MSDACLEAFTIILSGAEGPANIGSCCRAMKTMGFKKMAIAASPKLDLDIVKMYALNAFDIYENAKICNELKDIAADFSLLAGFTRRHGSRRKEGLELGSFASGLAERFFFTATELDEKQAAPALNIAIVFGNERNGLSNNELMLCDEAVYIPGSESFSSLNLSHAVQLACWELRKAIVLSAKTAKASENKLVNAIAGRIRTEKSAGYILDILEELGLYKLGGRREAEVFLRSLMDRSGISESELRQFENIFRKIQGIFNSRPF